MFLLLFAVILQAKKKEKWWGKLVMNCFHAMFSELGTQRRRGWQRIGTGGLAYTRVCNKERQETW